jgi:transposase-like protein
MRHDRYEPRPPGPAALLLNKVKRQMTADVLRGTLSIRDLCDKYDCTPSTLRILLKDRGATSFTRVRVKLTYGSPPAAFFADARKGVLTRQELAKKHGISYGAAAAHIREAGIKMPKAPAKLPAGVAAQRSRRKR